MQMLNYDNPNVASTRERLGPFNFNQTPNQYNYRVVKRPMMDLGNQLRYQGEWMQGQNIRAGKGIQIWPDGSIYEGWWRQDKANGRGRLIHADGDVYEGQWCDDKAQGYGIYYHEGGSTYEGHWVNDKQHGQG